MAHYSYISFSTSFTLESELFSAVFLAFVF